MYYKESEILFEKIKSSKRVVLVCHSHPDADSVGSNLSFKKVLDGLNIKTDIYCVDPIPRYLKFLSGTEEIIQDDVLNLKFEENELVLILDLQDWHMINGKREPFSPTFNYVVIDHHQNGNIKSDISIISSEKSSTSEILYHIFKDWAVDINSEVSTCLLAGIIADSGSFQYEGVLPETLDVAANLCRLGARRSDIYLNLYRSIRYESLQMVRIYLDNLKLDTKNKLIWTAVPYTQYKNFSNTDKVSMMDTMIQSVDEANVGLRITEKQVGILDIAIRSKDPEKYDASKLAGRFGGGGHKGASGAQLKGDFDTVLLKVINDTKIFIKEQDVL